MNNENLGAKSFSKYVGFAVFGLVVGWTVRGFFDTIPVLGPNGQDYSHDMKPL
jgi:hypothetical protein